MKRAILAGAGTIAGLASVLTYAPSASQSPAATADGSGLAGLAGPVAARTDLATPAPTGTPPTVSHASTAPKRPLATHPARHRPTTPSPSPSATPSNLASRPPKPKPKPTQKPSPKPSPTPKPPATTAPPSGPTTYTGSAVPYRYGTLQIAISVQAGKVVDAWAVTYPQGSSLAYSQMAIPILRSQTLAAQSASIAGATGATLTSRSWAQSLQAALSKAGL